MSKIGVLVANSSQAQFIHYHGLHPLVEGEREHPLEVVAVFSHDESRMKGSDLVSDKPGHYCASGDSRGAYDNNNQDPKKVTKEEFAAELAKKLNDYHQHHHFDKFLIVAPDHFYGLIKKHLSKETEALIYGSLQKDYTHYKEKELFLALREAFAPINL
ncbi:MAG: host attachment protein [Gammaproteobacteria bacterium]|nr:host attachment protein [Gammaproteobacteria bacterium]